MKYKNRLIVPTLVTTGLLASTVVVNAEEVEQDEQYSEQNIAEYSDADQTSETDLDFIDSEEEGTEEESPEDSDEDSEEESEDDSEEESSEEDEDITDEEENDAETDGESEEAAEENEELNEVEEVTPEEADADNTAEDETDAAEDGAAEETDAVEEDSEADVEQEESVEDADSEDDDNDEEATGESEELDEEEDSEEDSEEQDAPSEETAPEENSEADDTEESGEPVEDADSEEDDNDEEVTDESEELDEEDSEEDEEEQDASSEETALEENSEADDTEESGESVEDADSEETAVDDAEEATSEENSEEEINDEAEEQEAPSDEESEESNEVEEAAVSEEESDAADSETEEVETEEDTYKYDSESLEQELENLSEEERTAFLEENADDIEADEEMLNELSEVVAEDYGIDLAANEVYSEDAGTFSTMSMSQAITDINDYIAANDFDVAEIQYDLIEGLPQYAFESDYGNDPENGKVGQPSGVVLHDVGNENSTIHGEISYMSEPENYENAFVHAFVDADNIIQTANTDYLAYGAGPVSNQTHLHVELVRHDNQHDFAKSINNYADYIANLLYKYKLPAERVDASTEEGTLWSHVEVSHIMGGTASPDPYEYFQSHGYEYEDVISLIDQRYNNLYNKVTDPSIYMPTFEGDTENVAGEITDQNRGIYESITDVRTGDASNFLGQDLHVVRSEIYNYEEYYLLADADGDEIGWMYAGDVMTSALDVEPEEETETPEPEAPEENETPEPEAPENNDDNNEDETSEPEPDDSNDNEGSDDTGSDDTSSNDNSDDDQGPDNETDTSSEDDGSDEEDTDNDSNETPEQDVTDDNQETGSESDRDQTEDSRSSGESSDDSVEQDDASNEGTGNTASDEGSESDDNTTDTDSSETEGSSEDDSDEPTDENTESGDENAGEVDTPGGATADNEDGEVYSSLEDPETGVRVISQSDELDGKSLVVTVLGSSDAIGAAHDLYDIHVLDENGSLYNLNNPVTVYLPAGGYVSNVYYLGNIGETLEAVNFRTEDGYAVFEASSFSQYAVVYGTEDADNTTVAPVSKNKDHSAGEKSADRANEHPSVYTEDADDSEDAAAAADDSGGGSAEGTESEVLPNTGVAEQSTTIFATILAALGLGFLVKRRKTTEK